MLRFAPSPTGDMHIGNLRVALFNYLLSQQRNEPLLVRIEDTDKERTIEGKDQEILEILALFGIEYKDAIYQSNHLRFHRTMALQLLQDKKAFNCFCTPETLEAKRAAAEAAGEPYRYDGACEHLPPEMTIDNPNPFVIRLKKPEEAIEVEDVVKGKNRFEPSDIDSFIIMQADKHPTNDFACAVDDMLADISVVIRGEDQMINTPKQIAIRNALGYDKKIEYAHLPMILNDEGNKMNMRDSASSVKWMLESGFLPEAIANYLILIGNKVPTEIFTIKEAIEWFDLNNISKSPERFDMEKLRYINKMHLKMLDPKELSRYVGFADSDIGELAKIYLDDASTLQELREKIAPIFAPKVIPEEFAEQAAQMREAIKAAPHFEVFDDFKAYLMQTTGLEGKSFLQPLRLLLGGAEQGPEVSTLYPYLKNYIGEIIK